jgi:hypothetical protein
VDVSAVSTATTVDSRATPVVGRTTTGQLPTSQPGDQTSTATLSAVKTAPVTVKIDQLPGGLQHTTLVDTRTGLPVLELPLATVVQFVDAILWRQRHAKDQLSASEGGTQ